MTTPTKTPWASDALHPAGADPWSGAANKVDPPAARWTEGWHDELQPSAQHLNFLLNRFGIMVDRLNALGVLNWFEGRATGVTMPGANWVTGGTVDAGKVAFCGVFFRAIDEDGNALYTVDFGFPLATTWGGHADWEPESVLGVDPKTGPGWAAGATLVDIACARSGGGSLGPGIAVSNSAAGQVAQSPGPGSWAASTPATGGVLWGACAAAIQGVTERYVIGGNGGEIESSPTGVGASFTARTSGLAVAPILCMEHNDGPNGGYSRFVALTGTERSTSPDGVTWSAAAHGLTSPPRDLAYSHGYAGSPVSRWVAILENGTDVAVSDDQGLTWTQKTSVLSGWQGGTFKKASICSDGFGTFVATMASNTGEMMWASLDYGETWTRVRVGPGLDASSIAMGVDYGAARQDGGGYVSIGPNRPVYTPVLPSLGAP